MKINPALKYVKEIREISDIKEIANLLSTSEWIAIYATSTENNQTVFTLGRVELV